MISIKSLFHEQNVSYSTSEQLFNGKPNIVCCFIFRIVLIKKTKPNKAPIVAKKISFLLFIDEWVLVITLSEYPLF